MSIPSSLDFLNKRLIVCKLLSAVSSKLLSLNLGELAIWLKLYFSANCLKSELEDCVPLSDITVSGIRVVQSAVLSGLQHDYWTFL